MYLKSLHLIGFKSFADKTHVEFLPGVTAIVGPNGCGKSNVSDAIRWVLGEQSAKALRGGEMADVIFNGTDARKPFGMAEVSMTFAECGDTLKTGTLAGMDTHFNEVTITRRVFRDGNSDYLVNQTPCRLKDVQSLFMDTGIGRSSYSIMEQGKIDRILSAHPEDRRAIFEEAAGITKFKTQKKEALRKLEYTEANLVRVSDIIREVKRQIGSLQRQVSKARRYQALTVESKRLDSQLARHDFENIQSMLQSLEKGIVEFRSMIENARRELHANEEKVHQFREQLASVEQGRQQTLQRQRDIQSEIERQETRIQTNNDRMVETESAIQAAERGGSEARAKIVEFESSLRANGSQIEDVRRKLVQQAADLEQAQVAFKEADAAEHEHDNVIHHLQSALLGLEGSLAHLRNETVTLEKQQQGIAVRIQKLGAERSVSAEEKQKVAQRIESLQTEIQSYKQTFEASRHAVTGGEDAVREAEHHCQLLAARIADEQRILSEKSSRHDVLRQLQASYEGYSEGAQVLLRQLSEPNLGEGASSNPSSILGALPNLIEVEPRFSVAIEAALGQALQAIMVSEFQTALDLAGQLRTRDLGRALFVVQKNPSESALSTSFPKEHLSGALCWANEVVRAQPSVSEFVNRLLADTVVVSDLREAVELHRQNPGLTCVTVDGDILYHEGMISAGSRKASPLQLIGRRNEIAALQAEIAQAEARLHELSASKGEWEGRRALTRQSLGDRQSELHFQENDITKKEALLGAMQNEFKEFETKVSAAGFEIQELERQQRESELDLVRVRQELVQAETSQTGLQSELSSARRQAEELAAERHNRSVITNDLRVAHATMQQQIQNLESQIQPLRNQMAEAHQFIAARESDIQAGRQRIVQWREGNHEAERQIQALRQSSSGIAGQLEEMEKEKVRLDGAIKEIEENSREFHRRVDELQQQLTDQEVRLTEKRGDLAHLSERIVREYGLDLNAIQLLPFKADAVAVSSPVSKKEEAPFVAAAEEGKEEIAPPVNLEEPLFLDFANWEEVSARVAELRAKIQSMGPVNVDSVQEYEELEQRYTFLTREHDDLVLSKQQLLEILQKINVTTRKMFAETFGKIRENFQTVFTELFGGGKADLMLTDDQDPLECGIEIMAKPPGKQLQSIQLLSGGEKTMTAVSLLFAIYMVKPSPFCVLDEMDAPLDESNINRFVKMLERFLAHSQFIIITHNKRTIAMADALYGVTMEERGVSKLVSVKFHPKQGRSQAVAESPAVESNGDGAEEGISEPHGETRSRLLVDVPPLEAERR